MEINESGNPKFKAQKQKKKLYFVIGGLLLTLFVAGFVYGSHIFNNRTTEGSGLANENETENHLPTEADISDEQVDPSLPEDSESNDESDETRIRLQFAGDVFIHQGPIDVARTGENTFDFNPFLQHIAPFIDGDFVMANMESPVDAFGGNQSVAGWPYFNAPFEVLEALRNAGFNHLSSANNHAFDKGFEGLLNTVGSFERAGIAHTGLSVDMEDFNTPTIIDVNGIQVGVLAYTDVINHQGFALMPSDVIPFAVRQFRSYNLDDMPRMATDIADLREAGAELVVVSLHWGAEYVDAPTETQRLIAAELSEAGADVIMGHHSKTVQPLEWHYREDGSRALVMYSLGNFMVDQTRLEVPEPRTQYGMLVSLEVTRGLEGEINLTATDALPTLIMRDFTGDTLGTVDGVAILPIFDGAVPDFVNDEEVRAWGGRAYDHVVNIVGRQWITTD